MTPGHAAETHRKAQQARPGRPHLTPAWGCSRCPEARQARAQRTGRPLHSALPVMGSPVGQRDMAGGMILTPPRWSDLVTVTEDGHSRETAAGAQTHR